MWYTNCLCSEGKILYIHEWRKISLKIISFIKKFLFLTGMTTLFEIVWKNFMVEKIRLQCVSLIYGGNMSSVSVNDFLEIFSLLLEKFWRIFPRLKIYSQNFLSRISYLAKKSKLSYLNSLLQYLIKHFATFHRIQTAKINKLILNWIWRNGIFQRNISFEIKHKNFSLISRGSG